MTVVLNGNELEMPIFGTLQNLGGLKGQSIADSIDIAVSQSMFAFFAQYSSYEWGMAKLTCGTVQVWTNGYTDRLDFSTNQIQNGAFLIHSHPMSAHYALSCYDYDKAFLSNGYNVLFYNGQFRFFNYDGFIGYWKNSLW